MLYMLCALCIILKYSLYNNMYGSFLMYGKLSLLSGAWVEHVYMTTMLLQYPVYNLFKLRLFCFLEGNSALQFICFPVRWIINII